MPRQNRAKQFASFDALKGLQNALREKEREHENEVKNKRILKNIEDDA